MDSMVNHYTANRKVRNVDAYSPGGKIGLRPDRAAAVYCQRAREAFPGVPVIVGGIEASLRRFAHYDYWSDKVRPSLLINSRADLLQFGMGERSLLEIVQRLDAGEPISEIRNVRGSAYRLGASEFLRKVGETATGEDAASGNATNENAAIENATDEDVPTGGKPQVSVQATSKNSTEEAATTGENATDENTKREVTTTDVNAVEKATTGEGTAGKDTTDLETSGEATTGKDSVTSGELQASIQGSGENAVGEGSTCEDSATSGKPQATDQAADQATGKDSGNERATSSATTGEKAAKVLDPSVLPEGTVILPTTEEVQADKKAFAEMTRVVYSELNPYCAHPLFQQCGTEGVVYNPPALPLTTEEMDAVYALPFTRKEHPSYNGEKVPALAIVQDSIQAVRGCYGGCAFCAITAHEGKLIQIRSKESIVAEAETLAADVHFSGTISDIGGPTANMYGTGCKNEQAMKNCRKPSCLYPEICPNLNTDHSAYIDLLKTVRELPLIRNVFIASGIRTDLALRSPEFIEELAANYVGGHLKIAPEHASLQVLQCMKKPPIEGVDAFVEAFEEAADRAGKDLYTVPYFIASHPGSDLNAMLDLALYLHKNGYRPQQVQDFLPVPFDLATCMYYTGIDPMTGKEVYVPRGDRERKLQRAMLQYFKPENYFAVREVLERLGREDLIGEGDECLIRSTPPQDTERTAMRTNAAGGGYRQRSREENARREQRAMQQITQRERSGFREPREDSDRSGNLKWQDRPSARGFRESRGAREDWTDRETRGFFEASTERPAHSGEKHSKKNYEERFQRRNERMKRRGDSEDRRFPRSKSRFERFHSDVEGEKSSEEIRRERTQRRAENDYLNFRDRDTEQLRQRNRNAIQTWSPEDEKSTERNERQPAEQNERRSAERGRDSHSRDFQGKGRFGRQREDHRDDWRKERERRGESMDFRQDYESKNTRWGKNENDGERPRGKGQYGDARRGGDHRRDDRWYDDHGRGGDRRNDRRWRDDRKRNGRWNDGQGRDDYRNDSVSDERGSWRDRQEDGFQDRRDRREGGFYGRDSRGSERSGGGNPRNRGFNERRDFRKRGERRDGHSRNDRRFRKNP